MKKIFKKNQVIITALAIMIAVAGYTGGTGGGSGRVRAAEQRRYVHGAK